MASISEIRSQSTNDRDHFHARTADRSQSTTPPAISSAHPGPLSAARLRTRWPNIVMHGTFYVTHAVGRRWIANKQRGNVVSITVTMGAQRQPLCGALGDEQIGDPCHDHVRWRPNGTLRHKTQHHRTGEIPTEGMSKRINPAMKPARAPRSQSEWGPVSARWRNCRNLAVFLISGGCDWIQRETIAMTAGQAAGDGRKLLSVCALGRCRLDPGAHSIKAQNEKRPRCTGELSRCPARTRGPIRRAVSI